MKFKNKKLLAAASSIKGFLGLDKVPVADGKVAFSEADTAKLKEEISEEALTKLVDAFNKEIDENSQVKGINNEIQAILKEIEATEDPEGANAQKNKTPGADDDEEPKGAEENLALLKTKMQELEVKVQERDTMIQALIDNSEGDSPFALVTGGKNKAMLKNSTTHIFGSGKAYDAFEDRNWNKFAAGISTEATDWTGDQGVNVNKLNGDMELFFRENPDEIKSLHRDNFGLPAHWKKKMGVLDRVTGATIISGEITQARKMSWLPKNKQKIQTEEGRVYPVSIDIEFVGYLLQQIEASWMAGYNQEGSQAYKMTFVRFLVAELDKKARQEDRVATMKGVYVPTPEDATNAPGYIYRQNGLLYWAWKALHIDKKYRAFNIGLPTTTNIVDYVDNFIKSLPIDVRKQLGLEMNMSDAWIQAYKRRSEVLHGQNQDYKGYPDHPKDYANIKFVRNIDLEGSDFMFITFSDNIEILENIPKEKGMYTFEYLKRMVYIFADYKLGIRFINIGNKVKDGDPDEFKVQSLWSNTAPIFDADFFAPVYDDQTGEIEATFNQLVVDEAWKTDIEKINGLTSGMLVKIRGNTELLANKVVLNNEHISIGSNFSLNTGGTLTMIVLADGTLKELSRTTAPETATAATDTFDEGVIDADNGSEFTVDGSAAVAITEIINGVPNQVIKIIGNGTAALTMTTTNNIQLASNATLAAAGDYVELANSDGVWIEFNRQITA